MRPVTPGPIRLSHPACPWCEASHDARWLCDPVRQLLDAMLAKGRAGTIPATIFDEPMPPNPGLGLHVGDALLEQLVVLGAVTEVAGVARATVILTGRDSYHNPLPRWVFPGSDEEIEAVRQLFDDMAGLALRTAQGKRGQQ